MWLIYPVMLLWSKLIFPLQEGYQLQIIYWLWVWPHVYFLLSVLRSCLAWNCAALVHKCCTLCKPPSVSILLSMEDTVSVSPPLLLSFQTLCSLLHRSLWFLRGGFDEDIHLQLSAPNSLTVCILSRFGSLCLFPRTTRRITIDVLLSETAGTARCH